MSNQFHDFSNMVEFDALAQSITAKLQCKTSLICVSHAGSMISLGGAGGASRQKGRTSQLLDAICERTVRAGQPVRVADAQSNPEIREFPSIAALSIGAYLGVPLTLEGYGVIGAICVISTSARLWQDSEIDYLLAVGDLVESKIEHQLLRFERKALSEALQENDAILTMLADLEGKAVTVHNAAGDLVFANSALRNELNLSTREVLSLSHVASHLVTEHGGVDVALPVPEQTALNVQVWAPQNGLTLAQWTRKQP